MSNTAIGILLFVVVYSPVAYIVYDELTGRRSHIWSQVVPGERARRKDRRAPLPSRSRNESALSKHGSARLLRR